MKTIVVCTLLGLATATAAAQETPATPRVDARQERQDQRIENGRAAGQLTARETRRLEREQAGIQRIEDQAKADGAVTARERARLQRAQNNASRDVRRQKRDRQRVLPSSGPGTGAVASPGG